MKLYQGVLERAGAKDVIRVFNLEMSSVGIRSVMSSFKDVVWPTTHYSLAFLYNVDGVLHVEGYVLRETILDTGVSKLTLSKPSAAAMNIQATDLGKGVDFITASGVVEHPIGVSK